VMASLENQGSEKKAGFLKRSLKKFFG
jgi:hypothetical protein